MDTAAIGRAAGLTRPIRHQLFIAGRFVDAESGETMPSLNPHDNSLIADVALGGDVSDPPGPEHHAGRQR